MEPTPFSSDVQTLIERVAGYRRGLGFLRHTDLECAAITFGVHPRVILDARELLEAPRERERFIEAVRGARFRLESEVARLQSTEGAPSPESRLQDAKDLIHAAQHHRLGLPFLSYADLETVAVTFQVHPHVVLQAREMLRHGRGPRRVRSAGWRHHRPKSSH